MTRRRWRAVIVVLLIIAAAWLATRSPDPPDWPNKEQTMDIDRTVLVRQELASATLAAEKGDWDDVAFRLDQARMHTVDLRSPRRPFDVIVTWPIEGGTRHDWVRVHAATRELALMQGRSWAREAHDLDDDVDVEVSIDPESPL